MVLIEFALFVSHLSVILRIVDEGVVHTCKGSGKIIEQARGRIAHRAQKVCRPIIAHPLFVFAMKMLGRMSATDLEIEPVALLFHSKRF